MKKMTISSIDFNFLQYKSVLDQMSITSTDALNAYLVYNKNASNISLILQEATIYSQVIIPSTFTKEEIDESIGFNIGYSTLFYTLSQYKIEQLQDMRIELTVDDPSSCVLFINSDKFSLAHRVMLSNKIQEVLELSIQPSSEINSLVLSACDTTKDILAGLNCGLPFASMDETKNNAFAIYNDRLIINDQRHIFIYKYTNPIVIGPDTMTPISLHKKIAKLLIILQSKKIVFTASVSQDTHTVVINAPDFFARINNGMANINPPSEEDLKKLRPSIQVDTILASSLYRVSSLLSGYYKSTQEYKPVIISTDPEGIKFFIKDTGTSFSSCQVEICEPYTDKHTFTILSTVTSFNESLLLFSKGLNSTDEVSFFLEKEDNVAAIYLKTDKKEIYIAKLND